MRIPVSAVAFALFFLALTASAQSVPVPSRDPQLTVTLRNNQSSFRIVPDEAKLHRLIDLSVTATQKQQAEQFLKGWQTRPWPIMFMPVVGQVHIAQFQETSIESAKEKLLQFPPGSAFEWIQFGQEGEQKAFEEMSQFANEHSLKLAAKNVQK